MAKDFRDGGKGKSERAAESQSHGLREKPENKVAQAAGLGAVSAGVVLASCLVEQASAAEALPDGFVLLSGRFRVETARVLADGTLELKFVNGAVRKLEANDFVLLETGAVAIREDEAEALLLVADGEADAGAAEVGGASAAEAVGDQSAGASALSSEGGDLSTVAVGLGLGGLALAVGGSSTPRDVTAPSAPINVMLENDVLTFTAEAGSIAKIFNGDVEITSKFDVVASAGQFTATPKPGEFGGELLVITVTASDAAGNESAPSTAIQGTIGSGLGLPFAKGLFLDDAFVLTAKDVDGNEVFKIASDGTFTSDPDVGATLNVETVELDGTTFVRGFDLRFETFSGTLVLFLEDDGDDATPTFLNEADGQLVNLKTTLRAFAEVPEGGYGLASITPFTEIAVRLWEQATGDTFGAPGTASAESISLLRDTYNLVSEMVGFDVGAEKPVVTDDPSFSDADEASQLYGLKLAAFSSMLDDDPNVVGDINIEGGIENLIGTQAQPKIRVDAVDGKIVPLNFEAVLEAKVALTDKLIELVQANPDLGGGSQPISAERPEAPTLNLPSAVNATQSDLVFTGTVALKEGEELFVSFASRTFLVTDVVEGAWRLEPIGLEPRTGVIIESVADGTYDVVAFVTNASGNSTRDGGAADGNVLLLVDTVAPDAPQNLSLSGKTLTFTAEAGTTAKILDGTTDVTSKFTITESNGSFTAVAKPGTFDGTESLSVTVTVTDAAGNESVASAAETGSLDATAPDAPQNLSLSGKTLTFTAEAGTTAKILDGTTDVTSDFTITESNGTFTAIAKPGSFDGTESLSVTVTVTDAAGNESVASAAETGSLDATAPDAPQNLSLSGKTLTFTAEAGTTAKILDGTTDVTSKFTITESNGSFTAVAKPGTFDGTESLSVTVTVTDAAGNESVASAAETGSLDATAPDAPQNLSLSGKTLTFTAEAGTTAKILDGTTDVTADFTVTETNGTFTAIANPGTFDGTESLSVTVTVTDAAGNESAASPAETGSLDATAPDAPQNLSLSGKTLTFTAEAGTTAKILDGTTDVTADFTITESNGSFTAVAKPGTFDGTESLSVTVTVTDAAGNESVASAAETGSLDATAPDAPQNLLLSGATLTFTAEAGTTAKILDDTTDVTADFTITESNGTFTAIAKPGSFDGTESLSLTVTVTDTADNESASAVLVSPTIGFSINGRAAFDFSGYSVSSAGDVNGDGVDDVVIGAFRSAQNGGLSGASYVVFGKNDGKTVELSDVEKGIGGFVVKGVTSFDNSGISVSAAGDVNNDGLGDVIVGARGAPAGSDIGASYVVFGKSDNQAIELSDIEQGSGGFVIKGISGGDRSGRSVSSAGDVNGDGIVDFVVGAINAGPNGSGSGAAYVVFGKSDSTSPVEISEIQAGLGGFVINGASAGDSVGKSVSSAGDVNGDGLSDVIVGAYFADPNGTRSGASYVVFGKSTSSAIELADIQAGIGGFAIIGVSAEDESGISVGSLRDINGDGFDDLIVGAEERDSVAVNAGATYVIFGKSDGQKVDLSSIEAGSGGFVINGAAFDDRSGYSVSSAGDVNGDGIEDIILGAPQADSNGSNAGASYVVFGKSDSTAVDLGLVAAGKGGFVINGVAADDQSGFSVSAAGDMNGDGLGDLLVGAWAADPNGSMSGASFVVFGKTDGSPVDLSNVMRSGLPQVARIDTTAPDAPQNLSLSGKTLTFTAEAGATAKILDGTTDVTSDFTITESSGTFTAIAKPGTFDGTENLSVTVTVTDAAGNESVASAAETGSLDATAPDAPQNLSLSGKTLTFTAEAGTTAKILDGTTDVTSDFTITESSGTFTAIAKPGTFDGTENLSVTVTVTDAAGNESVASAAETGSLDATAPDAPQNLSLSGKTLTFTAEAGTTAKILDGTTDVTADFTITENPVGSFTAVANAGAFDGTERLNLSVTVTDAAGNESKPTGILGLAPGFVINGVSDNDYSGWSVSSAGDVNGDGYTDMIVGAPYADPNGEYSGTSFVVFGKTDPVAIELSDVMAGVGGFVVNGQNPGDFSGFSVSSAGDVDGDGLADLIIGALRESTNGQYAGASYVVFGKSDGVSVELSNIDLGNGGFKIRGLSNYDYAGRSVSTAGDVNGDGLDDLIVGAVGDDPNGSYSGASFVVFGKTDGTAVELSDVESGVGGFVVNGVTDEDRSGRSVSSAGDVNGDGLADLIIGAMGADPSGDYSGASYIIFGKSSGTSIELSDVSLGVGGFAINGASASDYSGWSVSEAGDVNGDGLADVVIGANSADPNGQNSGASYVVFGKTDGKAVELSDVSRGLGGFAINGITEFDYAGLSVSTGGDVNGDGLTDIIVAAPFADPDIGYAGMAYVIFGKTDGNTVELSDVVSGVGGFGIKRALDMSLVSVSSAGDVNGDGLGDLMVGVATGDPNAINDGITYVVFGKTDGAAVELSDVKAGNGLPVSVRIDTAAPDAPQDLALSGKTLTFTAEAGTTAKILDGTTDVTADFTITESNGTFTAIAKPGSFDGTENLSVTVTVTDAAGNESVASAAETGSLDATAPDAPTIVSLINDTLIFTAEPGAQIRVFNGSVEVSADFKISEANGVFSAEATNYWPTNPQTLSLTATDSVGNEGLQSDEREIVFGGRFIDGESGEDYSGKAVSSAGDVNGDGFDDILVGAPDLWSGGPGQAYVIFGSSVTFSTKLSDVRQGNGGIIIDGAMNGDKLGFSVSGVGDVNGDGFDDVLIGAPYSAINGTTSGAAYVVFGASVPKSVVISDLQKGIGGFEIRAAAAGDKLGFAVGGGRDINGDGISDLVIGAMDADQNGSSSGQTYVIFGASSGLSSLEVSDIGVSTSGFTINGQTSGDFSGHSISVVDDVNGDGLADIIVGAQGADPSGSLSGASYVVFGKSSSATIELSDISLGQGGGFVIRGASTGDKSGYSVSNAGDVNGDGLSDLIVGAINGGGGTGQAFLVWGKTDLAAVELSSLSNNGFAIGVTSLTKFDNVGYSVSAAGDLNGDGLDDIIVGATWSTESSGFRPGAAYVIFGSTAIVAPELTDVSDGLGGFKLIGASNFDGFGRSVSSAGDINGDGFDDLVVGALYADIGATSTGRSYVIFGGNMTNSVTEVGTTGDDTLVGASSDEIIFAGLGDDALDGGGGTDRLSGGAGADTFVVRNLNGSTTVLDFDGAEGDRLDVSDFALADFNAFKALLSPSGAGGHDTLITFDSDTSVLIEDVTRDAIVQSYVLLS